VPNGIHDPGRSMRDFYIFDIPVYRCRKERYYIEMGEAVEKHKKECFEWPGFSRKRKSSRETLSRVEADVRTAFGGAWEFNQIIGWVRLFPENNGLGAHVWFVEGRRLTRKMRKLFRLQAMSSCPLNYSPPPADSLQIFRDLLKGLEDMAKQRPLKEHYLDLSVLRRTAPFIDWRRMIDESRRVDTQSKRGQKGQTN